MCRICNFWKALSKEREDIIVCPFCGEPLTHDLSGEGLDICKDHGVVEHPGGIPLSEYERLNERD